MAATLVYPHQWFDPHPAISPGRQVFLLEDPLVCGNDPRWPLARNWMKLAPSKQVAHRKAADRFLTNL
jgi:deoxyribodipyrimidine photolyase-related protein